jgi:hypothetical protein
MGKKSREKKQRRMQGREVPGRASSFALVPGTSPAQQALNERILRGGAHYLQDNFIRIMQGSHRLRNEPEFRDLFFDLERTDAIRSRVMEKHEKQLPQVLKKSKDEQQVFYDEVRIEIIDELAAPGFRDEVLRRLGNLTQRLASGKEVDKFEMALILQSVLEQKEIPWGLCGLITAIYEASAAQAEKQMGSDLKEFEAVLQAAEREGSLERLLTQPDGSPEVLQVVQRLQKKPGLMQHLEHETHQAIQEFEQAIADGKVRLDLFTVEELQRPFKALAEDVSRNRSDLAKVDPQELANQFAEYVRRTLAEVMTRERTQRMKADLQRLSAEWLRARNWMGAAIPAEIYWLDSVAPAENPFLYAAYVSEMKRWRDAQVRSGGGPDASTDTGMQPGSKPSEPDAEPKPSGGLGTRVARFFARRKEP